MKVWVDREKSRTLIGLDETSLTIVIREHVARSKQEVTVYDYLDNSLPMLERMFRKREKGYKAMGYQFARSEPQTRLL